MRRRELRRQLERAAAAAMPAPRPQFTSELDQRLRATHPMPMGLPAPGRVDRRRREALRRAWRHGGRPLSAVGVAVVAGALLLSALPPATHELTLDGAREPAGAPGLPVVPPAGVPTASEVGPPPPEAAPASTPAPPGDHTIPEPTEDVPGEMTPTAEPTGAPPTTLPEAVATRPPSPSATAPADPPEEQSPAYGYAPPDRDYALELRARQDRDTAVHLGWSVYDRGEFASYVVLRAEGARMPAWPLDEHTEVIARVASSAPTSLIDREPWHERPCYRIVVLDAQGREVGRSRAVQAEDPPDGDEQLRPGQIDRSLTRR